MAEKRTRPAVFAAPLVLAPIVTMGLLSGMAMFGRKKETMPQKAARKLNELGLQQALDTAQQTLDELRVQVSSQDMDALRQQVAGRANTLVDSARTTLPPATQSASELARELAGELAERFKTDIAPVARDWAGEAVQEAEDILSAARQRASSFTETAVPTVRESAPEFGAKAGAAAGLVAGTAASAAQALGKRASAATSGKPSGNVQKAASSVGGAIGQAGSQTKYAVTQTVLIFFWLGALGSVIYYAILSPSQREKVRNFLNGAADQLQGVMSEFQGTDSQLPGDSQQ